MRQYAGNAQLALDTIHKLDVKGIPTGLINIMEHKIIERLAHADAGDYKKDPYGVYFRMMENMGICMVDQMLADNPLTIGEKGYEHGGGGATTGGVPIVDGQVIDSPEACVAHMEQVAFPALEQKILSFDEQKRIQEVILDESQAQRVLGTNMLKAGYAHLIFPYLEYYRYGYENYLMAYALYPEVMDRQFKLQADYAALNNQAVVKAFQYAGLPLYHRLDHDMADSHGLLVSLPSLQRSWVGQFARSIKPAVDAGFVLLWHCDGNLMDLIPDLLASGVNGFQGFQYEDGMDYVKICKMKDRQGQSLVIQAGVSVTRELPFGTPADVRQQLRFLVENGPASGLFLSMSSSCAPGTPWDNIDTAIQGFQYYREHGRG